MKITMGVKKRARIEMLPLIDIVFLLLVFFIYAMLSMAVHRGLSVFLPVSHSAKIEKKLELAVTIKEDGTIYLDREPVDLENLSMALKARASADAETGVLVFADRALSYQQLFEVLDKIQLAGLSRISLQAEAEKTP
ncbi:MAG: biopolymer transporter ExbD [Thermodesulfobacteriota bacterium]|nr:biopolymer transporter ExbD [Thermodesulfobacteriota bacterium]